MALVSPLKQVFLPLPFKLKAERFGLQPQVVTTETRKKATMALTGDLSGRHRNIEQQLQAEGACHGRAMGNLPCVAACLSTFLCSWSLPFQFVDFSHLNASSCRTKYFCAVGPNVPGEVLVSVLLFLSIFAILPTTCFSRSRKIGCPMREWLPQNQPRFWNPLAWLTHLAAVSVVILFHPSHAWSEWGEYMSPNLKRYGRMQMTGRMTHIESFIESRTSPDSAAQPSDFRRLGDLGSASQRNHQLRQLLGQRPIDLSLLLLSCLHLERNKRSGDHFVTEKRWDITKRHNDCHYLGISKNGDPPKWMVYKGKS